MGKSRKKRYMLHVDPFDTSMTCGKRRLNSAGTGRIKKIRLKKNKIVRVCLLCFCNNKGASGE
jgi:hypothetical protein